MQRRQKGIHRTLRKRSNRSNRNRSTRNRSNRSTRTHSKRSNRTRSTRSTHSTRSTRSKRIICNRTKGGNYDTDITTETRELVPIKSKDVVVAMPGHVFSAREYEEHMKYMDFQGQP